MAWNTNYELQPRNSNNPGYGAQAIRQLKKEIRERQERFNIFGINESDRGNPGVDDVIAGGTPKEGAARLTILDNDPGTRTDIVDTTTGLIGQAVVDLTELTTSRRTNDEEIADSAQGETGQLTKQINVVKYDSDFGTISVPLFTYDDMVDVYQDQSINGLKDYILPPSVPDLGVWADYLDANERLGAAVNFSEAYTNTKSAKDHPRYSATSTYNQDEGFTATLGTHPAPDGRYVTQDVSVDHVYANEIRATAVYGAVYA